MRKPVPCLVMLVILLLKMSIPPAHAVPSAQTPTPPSSENVLFQDDFSDPGSGWEIEDYDNGSVGYKFGVYFVISNGDNMMWGVANRSFSNVVIEVDATQISGPSNNDNGYGVVCREQGNGEGYHLLVSGDGYYAILKAKYGDPEWLVDWMESDVIRRGNATNHIRAVCDGEYLALFVNGERLAEARDATFNRGDIAFVAMSVGEPTEIHFDNLIVTGLGAQEPGGISPAQTPTPLAVQAEADALLAECDVRYDRGDFQGALEACQAALPLYRQLGDREGEAVTLNNIGVIYDNLFEYEQALVYYQQALPIQQEIGDRQGEAATLNYIGGVYQDLSDYEQALAYYQQALPIWREIGNRAGEAMTLTGIGMVYHALSDYKQALLYFEQGLEIAQEIGDRPGEAMTLTGIGLVYHALSDYEQALAYFQQALGIFREIGDREGEAMTLSNIGLAYYALSDYERALAYYQQALPIQQKIGDRRMGATTLIYIGGVYQALSDYEQALAYFQQALGIFREIGDRGGEAATLNGIGLVYHDLSDYEQALAYYQQALTIWREIGRRAGEAMTLTGIGMVYHDLSGYEQALAYFEQGLEIAREIGDRQMETKTLHNIGAVYYALSDYEQALAYYQQALPIQQEIGDRAEEAGTLYNSGGVYLALSDYKQALAYYQQALPIWREIGIRAGEAMTLADIGVVYALQSDYKQALAYLEQALTVQREIGDREGEAATLADIGAVYALQSDYKQALAYLEQALPIQREIGDRGGEAATLGYLAVVYQAQGQEAQALKHILQAIGILESIHGELKVETLQSAFAAGTADHYHYAVRLLLIQGREAEAFRYTERGRARTFLTLLGNQRVDPKGSEDPDLIQREAQLRGELAGLERQLQEEWSKPADQRSQQVIDHIIANLQARRQEYKELLTQLQLTNPEYATLVSINPLTLEEAQALLREQAPDVTLVSYFVGEEETVIFVVSPEAFHAETVSVGRKELRRQAEALLAQMKAQPLLPQAWQEPAQALYEWLVAPVRGHLPPANPDAPPCLGIIPHDLLHHLPFGLLYDGENTLLDNYTLFHAPSVSSLRFIFEKRHPQADTLLALANPDAPGAPHLRYAVEEAQAVAALFGTQPLIGPEATEGRLKAHAGEYGLLHVAAHSDYNPHSPLFSAILLQPDGTEDGRLETHEVFNLDLPQTDLVVLSACETHLGELSRGDELVGLERAFVRAGSPSLLTTLWPVDDAATAELMERFYTHLRAGVPKAEALRLAQMETRAEHPEPYYWAGFVLVGDYGGEPIGGDEEQQHRWLGGPAVWNWNLWVCRIGCHSHRSGCILVATPTA